MKVFNVNFQGEKTVFIVNAKTHATGSNILQPCITTEIHMLPFAIISTEHGKHLYIRTLSENYIALYQMN